MDVGLRASDVFGGDFLRALFVREHPGLLEQLDCVAGIAELRRDVCDQIDEVIIHRPG